MAKMLHLWIISDGKPGHENQSLGLADALARLTPVQTHLIVLKATANPCARLRAAYLAARSLPRPDRIIAAGHRTHLALLVLARKYDAHSILLMRPSLPAAFFHRIIAPEHDFKSPPSAKNIILTKGALNRITPASGPRGGKLILIGGPSKTHGWNEPALLASLTSANEEGGWELTDSRRTPPGFISRARALFPQINFTPHQETGPDWVRHRLSTATEVRVTEDSVSMIYEALGSGAGVSLIDMPRLRPGARTIRGLRSLAEAGFFNPASPPKPLAEADRCALILLNTDHWESSGK